MSSVDFKEIPYIIDLTGERYFKWHGIELPIESKCKRTDDVVCNFKTVFDNERGVEEQCDNCGRRIKFEKLNGRILEEISYRKHHTRDTLQPMGYTAELFARIYGIGVVKKAWKNWSKKSKEQIESEWDYELKDAKRIMRKMDSNGKIIIH